MQVLEQEDGFRVSSLVDLFTPIYLKKADGWNKDSVHNFGEVVEDLWERAFNLGVASVDEPTRNMTDRTREEKWGMNS